MFQTTNVSGPTYRNVLHMNVIPLKKETKIDSANLCPLSDFSDVNEEFSLAGQSWPTTSAAPTPPTPLALSFKRKIQFTKRAHVVNIRLHFKWRLLLISGFHWNTDLLLLQPWCRGKEGKVVCGRARLKEKRGGKTMANNCCCVFMVTLIF